MVGLVGEHVGLGLQGHLFARHFNLKVVEGLVVVVAGFRALEAIRVVFTD